MNHLVVKDYNLETILLSPLPEYLIGFLWILVIYKLLLYFIFKLNYPDDEIYFFLKCLCLELDYVVWMRSHLIQLV